MKINPDIVTLAKDIIYPERPDIVPKLYVAIQQPDADPEDIPFRLETYIRLASMPEELKALVQVSTLAQTIGEKIFSLAPSMGRPTVTHHIAGLVELQWSLSDGANFGLIFSNPKVVLTLDNQVLSVAENLRIRWRFHSQKIRPINGEFKSAEELYDFVEKNVVA
jgi:hypothetical protein